MKLRNNKINPKIEFNLDIENARLERNLRSGVFLFICEICKRYSPKER